MKKAMLIVLSVLFLFPLGSTAYATSNSDDLPDYSDTGTSGDSAIAKETNYNRITTLTGKEVYLLKDRDPFIAGPKVPNTVQTEESEHPQYDKAVTYYVEIPNGVKTAEGTARIRAWTTNSSGLIQTDRKSASTFAGLVGLVVTFIPGIGLPAQTIVSLAASALGETIDANQACDSKGYKSYKYYYRDGEAYSYVNTWWLEYRIGRRYTYKHTWGAYIDSNGYYSQYTKDYTPTNGYSEIAVESSSHYNQDTWVKTQATQRYWANAPYNECPW